MEDAYLIGMNAVACLLLTVIAGLAVVSPRVRDGVLVKLGMILISIGAFGLAVALATAAPDDVLLRALGLYTGGLLVVALGVVLRVRAPGARRRRASDWVALDTLPAE